MGPKLDMSWGSERPQETYDVLALTHFHSPSEHTVDGKHYDLELHFALAKSICLTEYDSPDCRFGVLAVFFDSEEGGEES